MCQCSVPALGRVCRSGGAGGLASVCFASSGVSDGGGAGHSSGLAVSEALSGMPGVLCPCFTQPAGASGCTSAARTLSVSPVEARAGLFCRLGRLASDESIV